MRHNSLIALFLGTWSSLALAHPHSWIDMQTQVVGDQEIEGLQMSWTFDTMASAQMLYSLDMNGGQTEQSMQELGQSIVDNVHGKGYFSYLEQGEQQASWQKAQQVEFSHSKGKVTVSFYLPLAQPIAAKGAMELSVFEPTHYVDMAWVEANALELSPALAKRCQLSLEQPNPTEEQLEYAANLGQDGVPDWPLGEVFTQRAQLQCSD